MIENLTFENMDKIYEPVAMMPFNICKDSCVKQCTQIIYEQMINNFLMFPILASCIFMVVFLYISAEDIIHLDENKKQIFDTVAYYSFALGIALLIIFFALMKYGIHIDQLIKI